MKDLSPCIDGPLPSGAETLGPVLILDKVCKEFPLNDGNKFVALRDLSLTIENIRYKPQIVSLLGPSGVGKTTTLRLIAGLDQPTRGKILITNGDSTPLRPVRVGDVGVVFQKYPLFEDISVLANLVEPAVRVGKMTRKDAQQKALHFLDDFGLIKQGSAWPVHLSGGQRQRVAILQQLMIDRYFIILDEPFSGLDPISIASVLRLITQVASQHELNTFILITHDVTSALSISDHVYLIGRERDAEGDPLPGARVIKTYDLIAEKIAYEPEVEDLPRFAEIRREIKLVEFPKL
ncbi:MAG TPA: ATP-binding cassette domain-containing protein [Acidobacteriota bacterium]|nr:ATP-binding cassette domain-containing protein [Acidobacteriota bacterium]